MTYELPAHGEENWDTKLNASLAYLKDTAETALAGVISGGETVEGSQAKADAAQAAAIAAAATDATTKTNAVQSNLTTHTGDVSNPHSVTKAQVGLGSVDNTSDASKPVSTATQTALNLKAPLASPTFTGTVAGVSKSMVGLGSVDNTADTAKPVSTAQQTALDLKADKSKSLSQQTASYTLVLADAGKWVEISNASANTLTVPPNSSVAFPVGTQIEGMQTGAGQTTITAGGGVTINADPGLKIAAQYGSFGLIKVATDTWRAYGRLSA